MNLPEKITALLNSNPVDEDGEPYDSKLLPGMTPSEISDLENKLGFELPNQTKELLLFAKGIEEGPMELTEFIGSPTEYLYIIDPKKTYLQVSTDGFGNIWFYDFDSSSSDLGPIYYYQHEGPMVFYQSKNIIEFMEESLRFMTPPYESLIDDVHEFRIKPINELNKDLIPAVQARNHSDKIIREYAAGFSEQVLFYDFRNAKAGDGFDMARMKGVDRHPDFPIYVLEPVPTFMSKIKSLFK
ncbi:MAG: SMI1/KNR4 family protein [Desulfuromonadaceae bacterium]